MRETNKRKNKFKLPGEIVRIETVETSQEVSRFLFLLKNQNQVFVQLKLKRTRKQEENKLKKKGKEIIEEDPPKKYTKSAGIAAKKISDKYKKIKKKKKH